MPVYEYYCRDCDGIFDAMRSMKEASWPVPCPVCSKDALRIMPTSFHAFTMREGYARRIPDRGTYWHLGKEVKRPVTGGVPANEHPDLYKPEPAPAKARGELEDALDKNRLEGVDKQTQRDYESLRSPDTDKKYYLELWKDHEQSEKKK